MTVRKSPYCDGVCFALSWLGENDTRLWLLLLWSVLLLVFVLEALRSS